MVEKASRGNACVRESWWQSLWRAEAEELRGAYTVRSSYDYLLDYPWELDRHRHGWLASTALTMLCRDKGL